MVFWFLFCLMSNNVVYAESLSPKEKVLSQRIQSIVSPFVLSSERMFNPVYYPGITITWYMQDVPPSVLRKTVLEFILQNSSDFKKLKKDSWVKSFTKQMSFFFLNDALLVELPVLLWENGQKKEALEIEKWRNAVSGYSLLRQRRLLFLLLLCNESIPKTVLEEYSKDSHFLEKVEKRCSFYGISFDASSKPDPDALLTALKRLLKIEPDSVFFDSPDVCYPDLVKKVFLKMKTPAPWSQEKIDAFKKKLSQDSENESMFFSTTMPGEDLCLLWAQFLEEKIGSATLKAALTTRQIPNHLSEEKALELARRLSNLGFLYQNLKTPKMKEAFQLFYYAEKLCMQYKITPSGLLYMHLASMYCAGHGTSVDHQKGFEYFQKGIQHPSYEQLILFSTFVYWFDLPISKNKQRNVSSHDLYRVFKAIMGKPVAVKNAFMQLYAQGLGYPWGTYGPLFMWDLLHRAFHSCFPNK